VAVDITHGVTIACEVSEPTPLNRAARRALRSRANRVPKHRELLFTITDSDVPPPFQVFWKARNNGEEAKRIGQLRGEIHPDEGHHQRKEKYPLCRAPLDGVLHRQGRRLCRQGTRARPHRLK
jgi:hypothetical protein